MAEKDKNNFVVNDKTYVKKPEIHYSYKFQPYVKDLGGSPGKNITQEDRNKRQRLENNVNAVRNVVKGLNNTFGKAISGAAAFYGGGWALNRLLHLNKPSTLGQFFGRYVLPANTVDNISDGVELIFDPSTEGAIDLGSGIVLGRFKDLSKPVRQVGELIGQGANINNMKNGGEMNTLEFLKNGSGIHIKEKNKGKFTDYCGGKVTDECIQKGKNSSNPAIRKRAVFAQNARHFKHKEGGTVKAQEGTKFNWGSAIGNLASTALQQGISTYMQNKKLSSDAEADKEKYKSEAASKLQKDIQDERTKRFNILNAIKGTSDNPNAFGGGIFENYFINQGDDEAIRNYNQSISDYNKMIDQQIRAQKAEGVGNFLSSLGQQGVGLLANSAFNKNSPASTNVTSSTNTSYNLSNSLSNQSTLYNPDKFWNMNSK